MNVGDLIRRLQEFDPKLPVCLADWNEGYSLPSLGAAEDIVLKGMDDEYYGTCLPILKGPFVCIGGR